MTLAQGVASVDNRCPWHYPYQEAVPWTGCWGEHNLIGELGQVGPLESSWGIDVNILFITFVMGVT